MAMNRDKFRNIVGGITTPEPKAQPLPVSPPEKAVAPAPGSARAESKPEPEGQGLGAAEMNDSTGEAISGDNRRFAKRGRPKGRKADSTSGNGRKVKVSLFLSEVIVNDLYEWAHDDKMHPGEMFEAALKPFHEKEAKRRKGGKG